MNIGNENTIPTVLSTLSNQSAINASIPEANLAEGNDAVQILAQNLATLTGQNNLLSGEENVSLSSDNDNTRSVTALNSMDSAINLLDSSNTNQDTQTALRQLSLTQSNVYDAINTQTNQLTVAVARSSVGADVQGPAHIAQLSNTIGLIKTNFLDVYRDITKQTTEYFAAFMDAVGNMSKYIEPGKDDSNPNKIIFSGGQFFLESLLPVINKYKTAILYTLPSPVTSESLDFWTKKLEPDLLVNNNGQITANIDTLSKIGSSVLSKNGEILTASFQALQSEVDSLKSRQQSAITRIMDTYRQDLSTFDNLINLLMGMYATETKINEGFLRY